MIQMKIVKFRLNYFSLGGIMRTAFIDLHLHLDGSLDLVWAYQQSLKRGIIDSSTTFEEYYDLVFAKNTAKREVSITKFDLMCAVLQSKEELSYATYHLIETLNEEGLYYAEIRFAPQHHTKDGLSQDEVVQAVLDGVEKGKKDFPNFDAGIILCLMHKGNSIFANNQENRETVEVAKKYYGKGVVGLDLAGYENNTTYLDYQKYFDLAKSYGIPFTLHAGEMGEGSHILDAILMGATRIGHGVNCIQKEEYEEAILRNHLPLEVCVTSNVKNDYNYASHPIRKLIKDGVKVTINVDNMIFARSDLQNEHHQLKRIGVSEEELMQCTWNALDVAFCDEETKERIRQRILKARQEES